MPPIFLNEKLSYKRKPFFYNPSIIWTPSSNPEVFNAWFDFSPETVTNSSGISNVNSKIGNYTLTQPLAEERPTYDPTTQTAIFNGNNSQNLEANNIPYIECYAVLKITSESPGVAASNHLSAAFVSDASTTQFFSPSSGQMRGTAWNGSIYTNVQSPYTLNQFDIWRYRFLVGVSQSIAKNDDNWVVTTGNVSGSPVVRIGERYLFNTPRYITGELKELIFTNVELSVELSQKLQGYLAHKRQLTDRLSSGHPYKTLVPR